MSRALIFFIHRILLFSLKKILVNNEREDAEHIIHENELTTNSKLNKIYSSLYIKHDFLQITSIVCNSIVAMKLGESN